LLKQAPIFRKKQTKLPYICLAIFLVTLISGPLFFLSLYIKAPNKEPITIIIPHGSSVKDITKTLEKKNLIINPILFRISSKLMANNNLKAGEYEFPAGLNILEATKLLKNGSNVIHQITIAEGLTSYDIASLLNNNKTLMGSINNIPEEGSLLPETYHYNFGDSKYNLIKRMQDDQNKLLEKLWQDRDQSVPFKTKKDAIILASIVEKETGVKASERPLVASVFINRLRKNIPLQSDPTVIYAITHGREALGRSLLRKDLSIESSINTYQNAGLPSQAICNPGKAAIKAVLNPKHTSFIYFVADGSGGHAFSKNLKEHNRNVAKWIKIRRKQRNKNKEK